MEPSRFPVKFRCRFVSFGKRKGGGSEEDSLRAFCLSSLAFLWQREGFLAFIFSYGSIADIEEIFSFFCLPKGAGEREKK